MDFPLNFKGTKVLITGHTGFKGSWLTLWLLRLGAKIIGYSLPPDTKPSLFELLNLKREIVHIEEDIRNYKYLEGVFQKFAPEIVFHLAAQPLVKRSYLEPRLTYETNVMGTLNVLEAIRKTESVRVCIVVTSDKCYENKEWIYGYREKDPLGGDDPYSSSKACAEILTQAYRKSFFSSTNLRKTHQVVVATVRAGNVMGGGDWQEDRLIPDCIRALSQRKPIVLRNPEAIRPWQHVLEPLYGYLLLAHKALLSENPSLYAQAWNFGPFERDQAKVREVVERIIKLWGGGEYQILDNPPFYEAKILRLDISKALIELGWKPKWDLKITLEKTINWYKTFYEGLRNMRKLTETQIEEYEKG